MKTAIVVILEQQSVRLGRTIDLDAVLTLVAVASEDPAGWDDIVACWPRYRTPPVPALVDDLPIQPIDLATARGMLDQRGDWIWIDLITKFIATGHEMEPIGRDEVFAMVVDESGTQHCPLSVHLPPWWELMEQTDVTAIDRGREGPMPPPRVDRETMFGEVLVNDIAARMLDVVESDQWRCRGANEDERARYDFPIQVHRDWLMTPRNELGGLMPRQMLHGGQQWIDRLVWGQRLRFDDGGRDCRPTDDRQRLCGRPHGQRGNGHVFRSLP